MPELVATLTFTRVATVRWPTYAVAQHATSLGYVSQLPEGLWLAYRDDGLVGRADSQQTAAAMLAARAAAASRTDG